MTVNISSSSSDQFVQSFLQWGLARQPGGDEGSYWADSRNIATSVTTLSRGEAQ